MTNESFDVFEFNKRMGKTLTLLEPTTEPLDDKNIDPISDKYPEPIRIDI